MSAVKRFVLNVFTNGELDEVVVGLSDINTYITPMLQNPPIEDLQDELVDLYDYSNELEEEVDD
jgi:hypothetical protein